MLRRQHFGEQRGELDLAPGAARLDVGQNALQVADADRQRLHLAQPFVHLLEAIGHLLERCPEPLIERRLQFFVDGGAYLFQFLRILAAHDVEPLLDGLANRIEPLLVGLGKLE